MAEINFSRDARSDCWIKIQNGRLETIQDWTNRINGYDKIIGGRNMDNNNKLDMDGKKFVDRMLIAGLRASGEEKVARQVEIFNKYGLSSTEGFGLISELGLLFSDIPEEDQGW